MLLRMVATVVVVKLVSAQMARGTSMSRATRRRGQWTFIESAFTTRSLH